MMHAASHIRCAACKKLTHKNKTQKFQHNKKSQNNKNLPNHKPTSKHPTKTKRQITNTLKISPVLMTEGFY